LYYIYTMSSILIAESGATKTDWCILKTGKKPVFFRTSGINPYLQSNDEITTLLKNELPWDKSVYDPDMVSYYGTGAGSKEKQKIMKGVLQKYFHVKNVEVEGDLLAAARSLCGDKKGIVCILGTGSNSCYYNGKKIQEQKPSLGYIAGDEGSGNHLGKRVLQYYAYGTFDTELKMAFEQKFGNNIPEILNRLYSEPFPNRYLATFVTLLKDNRGHFMVENIIEDCLNDFFHHHILKYRQSWNLPLHFTGSVSYEFRDVLLSLCNQYELELGKIEASPLEGLLKYYKKIL